MRNATKPLRNVLPAIDEREQSWILAVLPRAWSCPHPLRFFSCRDIGKSKTVVDSHLGWLYYIQTL
jgi:hypothetical protein